MRRTTIIFIGAGASRHFGIPTMPEFIEILDKELDAYEIYSEVKSSFNSSSFDLEVLMTVLEDLSRNKKELVRRISPQTSDFLLQRVREKGIDYLDKLVEPSVAKECSSKVKAVIRSECFKAIRNNVDRILSAYGNLFSLLHKVRESEVAKRVIGSYAIAGDGRLYYPSNLKIFTTNYDTCIETFLNRCQASFTQGVRPYYGYNVFDTDSFDDKDNKVGVFKLHGSVDLFTKDGELRQIQGFPDRTGLTYLGDEYGEELMRYPIEFGGYHHIIESPYLDLFRLFRERIKVDYQSFWLLIGSEFRDITICSIMNDVLRLKKRGDHPLIILVNPNAKKIISRLREWGMTTLAESIKEVEGKFGTHDYIAEMEVILDPRS